MRRITVPAPALSLAAAALLLAACGGTLTRHEPGSEPQGGTPILGGLFKLHTPSSGAAGAAGASGSGTTAAAAAPAPNAGNPLRGTELDGIFKKNPISNSQRPEMWPRVAVTIKSATAGVHNFSGPGTLRADDCVVFDARLWKSATEDRKFENLRLCAGGVAELSKGVAFRTLDLFPRYTFHRGQNTTAAQRTEGPTPPFYMFPQDIRSQQEWILMARNTKFYLGSILLALGYDWDNDFDRRVWIVGVPLQAQ